MTGINDRFLYFKRDAFSGIVVGLMAIPLSAGICIMSDYPVLTGLVTVIFACIVGFVSSLFRPGNFIGVPGIAAGLAPALALGVSKFGHENMPFLIFLTAIFQMVVWKYNYQRFILKMVPPYLVEGLLAGIGLKIALKFFPFLYEITTPDANNWFNNERLILLSLSLVSIIIFWIMFNKYSKTFPGASYISILIIGVSTMFYMELPILKIEPLDIHLAFPAPHPKYFHGISPIVGVVEMIGYALMLGTIDVIEQVMSNAAIEKLDPLQRHCDTNNSLLAIWIANLGSSFFGGMTNLDGLAKSSTNAFAGAYTKLSNLFTAAVVLIIVLFPALLNYLPQFSLGIIMIFSGWKMISGLQNVINLHGKYEIGLSIFCGLCVYKFGIFEGLLMALAIHFLAVKIFKVKNFEVEELMKD